MNSINFDWKMAPPTKEQIDAMWKSITFQTIAADFKYNELLKKQYDGVLYFNGFIPSDNEVFEWFCSRGRLNEIDFFNKFL